ncbi:MAG: hypothetical protein A2Y15_08390 [Clostridiales bacterium GWF2_36_10]|nr:MAG: hypothetical protein A2Y15_08390 [Clostridiales bacterium GWF2_36_10]HAN20320.1 hypothetical protein [Clostridiales bacterium]
MKRRIITTLFLVICVLLTTFFSCIKEDRQENSSSEESSSNNSEQTSSEDPSSSEEISDEISNEETSNDNLSITDIKDFDKLGLYYGKEDLSYLLIKAFLDKDTTELEKLCDLEKGVFDAYKSLEIGEYTITKGEYEIITFKFEIISSGLDTMPVGEYTFIPQITGGFTANVNIPETPIEKDISRYINMLGIDVINYDEVNDQYKNQYLISVYEYLVINGPLTLEQIQNYALKLFGIKDFQPDGLGDYIDGLYYILGHGGSYTFYDIVSEIKENEMTKVTVQYYADSAKTIKSHTYIYELKEIEGRWAFLSSTKTIEAPYKIMRYSN